MHRFHIQQLQRFRQITLGLHIKRDSHSERLLQQIDRELLRQKRELGQVRERGHDDLVVAMLQTLFERSNEITGTTAKEKQTIII